MGRILALDVGEKRIGIAVSDEMALIAQGIDVISRYNDYKDLTKISEIIEKYSASSLVVGMPFKMDGKIGESAKKILTFADFLKSKLEIPVQTFDERLTTVYSEKILLEADLSRQKRKKVIDKMAATILLQCFLDRRRAENGKEQAQRNM